MTTCERSSPPLRQNSKLDAQSTDRASSKSLTIPPFVIDFTSGSLNHQTMPSMSETLQPYAAIGMTILLVVITAAGMLIAAHVIGPKKRHGPVKDAPYESGMPVITEARRRFNIR